MDNKIELWAKVLSQAVEDKKAGPTEDDIKSLLEKGNEKYA